MFRNFLSAAARLYSSSGVVTRIAAGLAVGATLAVVWPGVLLFELPGKFFVAALKAVAPLLVFVLVIASLAKNGSKPDGRFRFAIYLYLLATFTASATAVAASFLFPTALTLDAAASASAAPAGIGKVLENLLVGIFANPVAAISEANYMGILFWAAVFGVIARKCAGDSTKAFFCDAAEIVSGAVRLIISLAGFGVAGLAYASISHHGLAIFRDYGRLVAVLVSCMLFVALAANPLLAAIALRRNPFPLIFRCIKESGIPAFFTRSSAANIPVNIELCRKLGLDESFYSVSIPLGATINMSGAAVTITVLSLATANTLGVEVDMLSALVLSGMATIASCGASGVAGGSLLLVPLACSMFGIGQDIAMQTVGVGFIIGVVQDSFETALNSSSDVLFTAVADMRKRF